MKVCLLVWLLSIAVGLHNESTVVKTLDCNNPDAYRLVVITDPDRDPNKTVTEPKVVKIVAGDETKAAIKIPTDSDAQNFSLSSAKKTQKGFEITIEYGVQDVRFFVESGGSPRLTSLRSFSLLR
jgi:hypothetical protein